MLTAAPLPVVLNKLRSGLTQRELVEAWVKDFEKGPRKHCKLYFVTHTFVAREKYHDGGLRNSTAHTALKPSYIWTMYEKFYVRLLKKLLGKHFNRKRPVQPFVVAFIDLPFTSSGRCTNSVTERTPHVHAVYAVHPDTLERFKKISAPTEVLKFGRSISGYFQSVDIREIRPNTTWTVLDYSSKYLGQVGYSTDQDIELWKVYPVTKSEC